MIDPSRRAQPIAFQAQDDFARARRKVFLDTIGAFLTRRPNELLSFNEVRERLPIRGQVYRGVRAIPVSKIIGSVDRYEDFNRHFLPTQTHTQSRWEGVDRAALADIVLPPIEVYQVGDAYFVMDGNHRVSVAKEKGMAFVDAQVVEIHTKLPLSPETDHQELVRLAEYARFLEQTALDTLRPGVSIRFTTLGRYDVLIEHISAHRGYMGIEDHRYYLSQEQGRPVGPQTAVLSYNRSQVAWARRVLGWTNKLLDHVAHPFVISAQALARALKAGAHRP